ncbi:hypothetical protein Cgig2_011167 [Carnegiea gigantea]|uniref:Uncharacterized protein n=1 Tax=Carnegiea gigantea TaxID=171969 RepID=A0A9Q1JL32_9CARY|nr:hypothetical protein Cgig2_011167 [Carnegiea gigantea]
MIEECLESLSRCLLQTRLSFLNALKNLQKLRATQADPSSSSFICQNFCSIKYLVETMNDSFPCHTTRKHSWLCASKKKINEVVSKCLANVKKSGNSQACLENDANSVKMLKKAESISLSVLNWSIVVKLVKSNNLASESENVCEIEELYHVLCSLSKKQLDAETKALVDDLSDWMNKRKGVNIIKTYSNSNHLIIRGEAGWTQAQGLTFPSIAGGPARIEQGEKLFQITETK